MNRIRVLQILWDDDFGGAERHVADLVLNLDHSVFDCEVCILRHDGNRVAKIIREHEIPVHCMNLESAFGLTGPGRLIKFVRNQGYDIVHAHTYPLWTQIAVGVLTPCVNLVTSHGRDVVNISTFRSVFMNRISRFATDGYITPSAVHKGRIADLYHIPPEKIHVMYHGVDFSRFHPLTSAEREERRRELGLAKGDYGVGTIGRLTDQKNYPCFIRSAVRIHEEMPNTKFFIVGHGELEDQLREMVGENGAEDYIIFLGRRTDVPGLLGAWDIFLFTTWIESFGIVVLEAMANELAVVVSDSSSLPEVVGDTGILVKVDDDASFAREVVALLKDEDRRREMAREARERALDLFSMNKMIDTVSEIYTTLLAAKKKGSSSKTGS